MIPGLSACPLPDEGVLLSFQSGLAVLWSIPFNRWSFCSFRRGAHTKGWNISDPVPVSVETVEVALRLLTREDGNFLGTHRGDQTLQFMWRASPEGMVLHADVPTEDAHGELVHYNGRVAIGEALEAVRTFADLGEPYPSLLERLGLAF